MKGKISIPRHVIINELRDRHFNGKSFENLNQAMGTALTLLGIDEPGKLKIEEALQNTREDILAAEKDRLKIIKDDSTSIEIDTKGMKDAMPDIIAATQARINEALPSDASRTINESIDWEQFYCGDDYPILKFGITRRHDGTLVAEARYPDMSLGIGLQPDRYPQNGSPILLDDLFDDRWSHYLKGKSLVPVPEQN